MGLEEGNRLKIAVRIGQVAPHLPRARRERVARRRRRRPPRRRRCVLATGSLAGASGALPPPARANVIC